MPKVVHIHACMCNLTSISGQQLCKRINHMQWLPGLRILWISRVILGIRRDIVVYRISADFKHARAMRTYRPTL